MCQRMVGQLLVILNTLCLLLTGCSGTGVQPRVEVAAVWTGTEEKAFRLVLHAFEKQAGVHVVYLPAGDDIAAVLGTRLQGGNPPDLAILPQPGLLLDLVKQGALKPIQDVAGKEIDRNYGTAWRDLGSANGILYGVWFKTANKSTVWYNANVFRGAGVRPPPTWDAWLQISRTISAFGVAPFSVAGADGWTLTDWFENVYLRSAGPVLYDKLTRHEIPWTHPSVHAALSLLAEIFGNPRWIAAGTAGALQTDFPTSVTQVFRTPPRAAMVYEGDFVAGVIQTETRAILGRDADFFDFPAIGDSPPSIVGGGDVAVLMKASEGGKGLIRFLATPEAGAIWAKLGGFTSPNKNVPLADYPDEIVRRSAQALVDAQIFRFDMSDQMPAAFGATPGEGEWQILQEFLRHPADIRRTMQRLEASAALAYNR